MRICITTIQRRKIEGMIFHSSPIIDKNIEAVKWAKEWIKTHGDVVEGKI